MHIQARKLKSGVRYYLRYWEKGKNKCVPRKVLDDDPTFAGIYPFENREDAEFFIKKKYAMADYKNHSYGLSYLKNKKKYYSLDKMTLEFFEDVKESCPMSYESSMLYFSRYVLPYFVFIKKELNVAKWHMFFRDYRNWLRDQARVRSDYSQPEVYMNQNNENKPLSYSSKNHCIRILNSFLKSMVYRNYLPPEVNIKCQSFERYLVDQNARTHKDIVGRDEYEMLKNKLGVSKDFFTVLYNTGMRFSELYSLSSEDLFFEEHVEDGIEDWMKDALIASGYKIYGYVVLTSQIADKVRSREPDGSVKRKPLKGRKSISLKDGRVIPIMDEEAMNVLIERYNRCLDEFDSGKFGVNEKNYFLFDEGVNEIRRDFSGVSSKGFHASCRHSFTTHLIGKTRNQILTRSITGHRSIDVFDRYVHIYEAYLMKATVSKKRQRRLKLADEFFEVG